MDEYDALMQIITIQQMVDEYLLTRIENITLIGIVNLHVLECQNKECICKNETELYDPDTGKASEKIENCHSNPLFLRYFIKQLYEDALSKFLKSPLLHTAFAGYLFKDLKNNHVAAVELGIAASKDPSLKQQFSIYKIKVDIENHLNVESKANHPQLINVIKFEELFESCQKIIETIVETQLEFWDQVSNSTPDFNILNSCAEKIFDENEKVDKIWKELTEINPNYSKALRVYGDYLVEIRNNIQIGNGLRERGKENMDKKSLEEVVKSTDTLFLDNVVVIHISGNNIGTIVKVNNASFRVFGYKSNEMVNHSVNMLMPRIYGKEHNHYLKIFFSTGRQEVLKAEEELYALNKDGFCFCIKLFVKPLPNLDEGIQYVGMIRQEEDKYDYILTDHKGVIDSFSQRIGTSLEISPSIFKDNLINIQILAPELISGFKNLGEKSSLSKFKKSGGHKLTLIIPKDFKKRIESKESKGKKTRSLQGGEILLYVSANEELNCDNSLKGNLVSLEDLTKSKEYKEPDKEESVTCEIIDKENKRNKNRLKVRVFKISGLSITQKGSEASNKDYSQYDYGDERIEDLKEIEKIAKRKDEVIPFLPLGENKGEEKKENTTTEKMFNDFLTTEKRIETNKLNFTRLDFKGSESSKLKSQGKPDHLHFDSVESDSQVQDDHLPKSVERIKRMKNTRERNIEISILESSLESEESTPRIPVGDLKGPPMLTSGNEHSNSVYDLRENKINDTKKRKIGTVIDEKRSSIFEASKGQHNVKSEVKSDVNENKKTLRRNDHVKQTGSLLMNDGKSPCIVERRDNNQLSNTDREKNKNDEHKALPIDSEIPKKEPIKRNKKRKYRDCRIIKEIIEYKETEYKRTKGENEIRSSLLESHKKMNKNKKEEKKEKKSDSEESEDKSEIKKDDVSYLSKNTEANTRSKYSLRAAIDEDFTHPFITKMTHGANLLFLLILAVAIVYFALQLTLYNRIKENVDNIDLSDKRLANLLELSYNVVDMIIISADYNQHALTPDLPPEQSFLYVDVDEGKILFEVAIIHLKAAARRLKEHQIKLSRNVEKFPIKVQSIINPADIMLTCINYQGHFNSFPYSMWQAIMELSVSAYRITGMAIGEVDDTNQPTVFFLVNNSLNNIFLSLSESTEIVSAEIFDSIKGNNTMFIILLCVASVALGLAITLMIPVLYKVKISKEEVYELFMLLNKREIKDQLDSCKKFSSTVENKETEYAVDESGFDENHNDDGATGQGKIVRRRRSHKKFKRLTLNLGFTIMMLLLLLLIMEGYFILNYLLTHTFLEQASSLAEELDLLLSRLTANLLLFITQKMALYKAYDMLVKNQDVALFLTDYYDILYSQEERLLETFSKNYYYHSKYYSDFFNNVFFSNVCEVITEFHAELEKCTSFYHGILTKGMYSTVVKYSSLLFNRIWDELRQMNRDYLSSNRNVLIQYAQLNSEQFKVAAQIKEKYFLIPLLKLADALDSDIDEFFLDEQRLNKVLFGLYLGYLVIVYFIWNVFLFYTKKDLWKTKSILCVLHADIISSIPQIKEFITNNSSAITLTKTDHD